MQFGIFLTTIWLLPLIITCTCINVTSSTSTDRRWGEIKWSSLNCWFWHCVSPAARPSHADISLQYLELKRALNGKFHSRLFSKNKRNACRQPRITPWLEHKTSTRRKACRREAQTNHLWEVETRPPSPLAKNAMQVQVAQASSASAQ